MYPNIIIFETMSEKLKDNIIVCCSVLISLISTEQRTISYIFKIT